MPSLCNTPFVSVVCPPAPPPPEETLILENTLVVAQNGDDATGERNDWKKPYLTIGGAVADALDGDVIYIMPGTYSITATITKDVTLQCTPEVTINSQTAYIFSNCDGNIIGFPNVIGRVISANEGQYTIEINNLTKDVSSGVPVLFSLSLSASVKAIINSVAIQVGNFNFLGTGGSSINSFCLFEIGQFTGSPSTSLPEEARVGTGGFLGLYINKYTLVTALSSSNAYCFRYGFFSGSTNPRIDVNIGFDITGPDVDADPGLRLFAHVDSGTGGILNAVLNGRSSGAVQLFTAISVGGNSTINLHADFVITEVRNRPINLQSNGVANIFCNIRAFWVAGLGGTRGVINVSAASITAIITGYIFSDRRAGIYFTGTASGAPGSTLFRDLTLIDTSSREGDIVTSVNANNNVRTANFKRTVGATINANVILNPLTSA